MPQIIFADLAQADFVRIRDFYQDLPEVGRRALQTIKIGLLRLVEYPSIGKPNERDGGVTRLLPIGFGASGFMVKYYFDTSTQTILILGVRSFREAGFSSETMPL